MRCLHYMYISYGFESEVESFLTEDATEHTLILLAVLCDPNDQSEIEEEDFFSVLVSWKNSRDTLAKATVQRPHGPSPRR